MADAVLGQIFDWIYGKLVGFFSEFFEMMNMMGAELFDLPWRALNTPSSPNRGAATCTALRSMGSKASWP